MSNRFIQTGKNYYINYNSIQRAYVQNKLFNRDKYEVVIELKYPRVSGNAFWFSSNYDSVTMDCNTEHEAVEFLHKHFGDDTS